MNVGQWKVVVVVGLVITAPAFGQMAAPSDQAAKRSVLGFSGMWKHQSLPGTESPAPGPGPPHSWHNAVSGS
jgi:hypothetical protein